ncbi:MAG: hypothetical protein ABIF87_11030 [Pseudomonadota bacterium]
MRCFRLLKRLFPAVALGVVLLLTLGAEVFGDYRSPDAVDGPDSEVFAIDRNAVKMDAMNIWGKVDKPTIMYVIPRAHIEIEMKLDDEYFSSIDPDAMPYLFGEQETVVETQQASQALFPDSFSATNTHDVQNGLCTSCHYPEMLIPHDDRNRHLLTKLNHICLQCHPLNYYRVAWKEVERAIFCESSDYLNEAVCEHCHPGWIQQAGKYKSSDTPDEHAYNANELCKIYHKFRAAKPRKNR